MKKPNKSFFYAVLPLILSAAVAAGCGNSGTGTGTVTDAPSGDEEMISLYVTDADYDSGHTEGVEAGNDAQPSSGPTGVQAAAEGQPKEISSGGSTAAAAVPSAASGSTSAASGSTSAASGSTAAAAVSSAASGSAAGTGAPDAASGSAADTGVPVAASGSADRGSQHAQSPVPAGQNTNSTAPGNEQGAPVTVSTIGQAEDITPAEGTPVNATDQNPVPAGTSPVNPGTASVNPGVSSVNPGTATPVPAGTVGSPGLLNNKEDNPAGSSDNPDSDGAGRTNLRESFTPAGTGSVNDTNPASRRQENTDPDTSLKESVLFDALVNCTGWGQSAGSSLRAASAATDLLKWANEAGAGNADAELLEDAVTYEISRLSPEERASLGSNWSSISFNASMILDEYDSIAYILEDAGCSEAAKEAAAEKDVLANWQAVEKVFDRALLNTTPQEITPAETSRQGGQNTQDKDNTQDEEDSRDEKDDENSQDEQDSQDEEDDED